MWPRVLAVWLLIMLVESMMGALREAMVSMGIVDGAIARRAGVFVGVLFIYAMALVTTRWIARGGRLAARCWLAIGLVWAGLTVLFEIAIGRVLTADWPALWQRLAEDYDPRRGGLMLLGLGAMALAPWLAARANRHVARGELSR